MVRASAQATSRPCVRRNRGAELGGHELPGCHDARAGAVAHLAHQRDPGGNLPQLLRDVARRQRPAVRQLCGEAVVPLLDGTQLLLLGWRTSAESSSRSRRSVMPVMAECTINTRAPPAARRWATILAMLRQLAREETLVPPNFRTIQAEAGSLQISPGRYAGACGGLQADGPSRGWLLSLGATGRRGYSSSSKSRRSFSSFLSASTSSSLLQAALPRLPWLRTRLSTRSSRRS